MSGFIPSDPRPPKAAPTSSQPPPIPVLDFAPPITEDLAHGGEIAQPTNSWVHAVAGGIGSLTSATLTMPLDVLKTRLQSDFYRNQIHASRLAAGITATTRLSPATATLLHFRETFQILFAIPKVEGYRALFKGLGPNLAANVPTRAIQFYVYGNGKRVLSRFARHGEDATWVHLSAAACAGAVTSTAVNPIHVVKTRVQLDKTRAAQAGDAVRRKYRHSLECARDVVRTEGVAGLYKGLTASYLGVSELVVQWGLYERMKRYLRHREERIARSGRPRSAWDQTVEHTGKVGAAGAAKLFAAVITYPHEVVRTRLRQAPRAHGAPKYTGLVQCFRLVLKEEGMASIYGGLTPHLLRTVPSSAILFGMYEYILPLFGVAS